MGKITSVWRTPVKEMKQRKSYSSDESILKHKHAWREMFRSMDEVHSAHEHTTQRLKNRCQVGRVKLPHYHGRCVFPKRGFSFLRENWKIHICTHTADILELWAWANSRDRVRRRFKFRSLFWTSNSLHKNQCLLRKLYTMVEGTAVSGYPFLSVHSGIPSKQWQLLGRLIPPDMNQSSVINLDSTSISHPETSSNLINRKRNYFISVSDYRDQIRIA